MDDQAFQYTTIGFLILVIIFVLVNPADKLREHQDQTALDFIYTQCMNETSINLTFTTGTFYLAKENQTCLLGRGIK